ncbi:MAG: bifunctional phosphoglucose/phosphomannose isomerase [Candidatus Pacebacteria bacterium]|nr:bifunctional phosphoglucose/phosphomannose isomerase [Candidatus Paceibacterota bacterium]
MKEIILSFPKQFEIGIKAAESIKIGGDFDNIVICGVGGSALPGSLLLDMANISTPVFIHRDYGLPKIASEKSLIICISFSGNTEETISAYQEAVAKNYKVIAICTAGKLKEIAEQNNLPVAVVPNDCLQPRFGTGCLVSALIKILDNCKITNNLSQEVLGTAEDLNPESFETQGKALAEKLINKIPVIYSSKQYKSIARIWKIKFNENSKIMAFWNYFPELNHNEMVGLTNIKSQISNCKYHFIILRDKDDHPRILKRMELTADLIKEAGAEVDFMEMTGATKLEKIFNALLFGDWASYYLALAYMQDPTPVYIVENFKKRLA